MESDEFLRYKTGISQAYWCDTGNVLAEFQPAKIAFGTSELQPLSWFDKLFEGGLLLPKGGDELHPLTMLVSGPPGSGKTTLISELCYRLAVNEQGNDAPLSTLYISTDAETHRMIYNAVDMGWEKARDYFVPFDPSQAPKLRQGLKSVVAVWGRDKFLKSFEKQEVLSEIVEGAINSLDQWILKAKPTALVRSLKRSIIEQPIAEVSQGGKTVYDEKYIPDILVVDSLNILNPEGQMKFFQSFMSSCKAKKLVVFVLNTGTENLEHMLWEYFTDMVVHLDYEFSHDYYVRTIEVLKARFQPHLWGRHQLKIYANSKPSPHPTLSDARAVKEYNTTLMRAHPYRPAGGVFIFPSIHSYLSVYKRKTAADAPSRDETYPTKLNEVMQIPRGKCTAFIGQRGGHKSHLAYLHMLYRMLQHGGESGLIVSLREDEGTTKETLAGIAKSEFNCSRAQLDALEKDNHLEVLYFPPGYITPEEFFHRIFISVHRLKRQNSPLTVMFNSLDQISARFPLCAKQEIFIPGIIQTLSGEGATSICIAVDEPGQPVQQYGLLPMADLIVSFCLESFPVQSYYEHIGRSWADELAENLAFRRKFDKLQQCAASNPGQVHEAIVLRVVRYSGGERAGKRGIVELVKRDEMGSFPYPRAGLSFSPIETL